MSAAALKCIKGITCMEKAVWLIAGGAMQKLAADCIKSRGFRLIVSDGNENCKLAKCCDMFLHLDIFDLEGHINSCEKVIEKYEIIGIFTAGSDCHETVSMLSVHLGLPGIDPKIAEICRKKHLTRRLLTEAGVPQPNFQLTSNFEQAVKFCSANEMPIAMKATDNSGSRGFFKITQSSDLTEEKFEKSLTFGTTGSVLMEDFLAPTGSEIAELSIETLWVNGQYYWLNWVDRLFRNDFDFFPTLQKEIRTHFMKVGWAVELAHINPATHSNSLKNELENLTRHVGKVLKMDQQPGAHILKFDIMLTDKGPVILEMTPRLSGGWDSSLSTPLRGANFVDGMLGLLTGDKFSNDFFNRYFTFQNDKNFVSVIAQVENGSEDCIGRKFVYGSDKSRLKSVSNALQALTEKKYVD